MAHSYFIRQIRTKGAGWTALGLAGGEVTMTDKELDTEASNTKPTTFAEYWIFNSHNTHFMYIKVKGHWACGTLYDTVVSVITRTEFSHGI